MNTETIQNLTGRNDIVFKAIMLTNTNILKALLQTLMKKNIKKIKILNSELPKQTFFEKGKRLDAYLETEREYVDVEVSTGYTPAIQNRNISYVCHVFCHATVQGENYSEYKKSHIYNLVWNMKSDYLFQNGQFTDQYGNIISDMVTFNLINMDNMMERYYNEDIKFIKRNKYLIMLGLTMEELDELIKIIEGDEIVMAYKEALERVSSDYEIAPYIEGERDREMLFQGILKDVKDAKDEVEREKKEAIKQGVKQGIEQGVKQGIEQGVKQGIEHKQREIINKLFSKGMEVSQIAQMLDMTQEMITSMLD